MRDTSSRMFQNAPLSVYKSHFWDKLNTIKVVFSSPTTKPDHPTILPPPTTTPTTTTTTLPTTTTTAASTSTLHQTLPQQQQNSAEFFYINVEALPELRLHLQGQGEWTSGPLMLCRFQGQITAVQLARRRGKSRWHVATPPILTW